MKKVTSVFFILTLCSLCVFGQSSTDSITKSNNRYYQGNSLLTQTQLRHLMKDNPAALKHMNSAKSMYYTGIVCGYVGGFMIGWPLGTALGGGDPNWELAMAGSGLAIFGVILGLGSDAQIEKAVDEYNSGLQPVSMRKNPNELQFFFVGNGAGLRFTF